ncbi:WD40 repeat-like protein [Coprinellus micaceus]|uniref:WD40 repeat-like protein n=1 Tax=Coprinellus micaceus TaxID=71717 RepID=A0A4Y7TIN0_COPMI|nr:WD40 repeat-like protein [Coprinellus micaceus]
MSSSLEAFQTPAAPNGKKRFWTPASAPSFRSHKKRRIPDISTDSPSADGPVFRCENISTSSLDRFISVRPQNLVPLTISPRTNRMYKTFGMLSDQRLSYKDENVDPSSETKAFNLLRKSASSLFSGPKSPNGRSVTQNLGKNAYPTLILDSPGLTKALYSSPISWSVNNRIGVACGRDVYYQDLETRKVTHFFTAGTRQPAKEAVSILWGGRKHENKLTCITDNGACELFETDSPMATLLYEPKEGDGISPKSMCWKGDLFSYGLSNGGIRQHDVRDLTCYWSIGGQDTTGENTRGHRKSVISLAYDSTGKYLASGDIDGNVHIWDIRTRKSLTEVKLSSRIRHRAPVKALAWCPWRPDLLATGGFYPEGIIQFWNTKKLSSSPFEPEKTFIMNAAVHSLIWSPHCKEILSVHGVQFQHEATTHRHRRLSATGGTGDSVPQRGASKPTIVPSGALTHSLIVHDYPSGKRVLSLPRAHRHTISAACLGPNGQDVFTASPKERAIKMWQVWGEPPKCIKEAPFASCTIR